METAGRKELIALLQAAYSGERAAALAYHGHARSVSDAAVRERISAIEAEELHHRRRIGEMLFRLDAAPDPARERRATIVGRTLGVLCRLSGWLTPMFGAGKLESRNVHEYETAARLAARCGRGEWVDEFLTMAEVEWEHEAYFRAHVKSHWLGRRLRLWSALPPKPEIRASFAREAQEASR